MIIVGTSGFQFADWRGPVYPEGIARDGLLPYYERELGFGAVEINFSYYSIASPRSYESMLGKTSSGFKFVVKAYQDLTHKVYKRGEVTDHVGVFDHFKSSIAPLLESGRLHGVLFQFPYSFKPCAETFDYLKRCRERFPETEVIVEFRFDGWHKRGTYYFMREEGLAYCAVDEPGLKGLYPYYPAATSDKLGYFRFHGRNKEWFTASAAERYNYHYNNEELESFLPGIRKVEKQTEITLVFFNNCHAGTAARNALDLIALLLAKKT